MARVQWEAALSALGVAPSSYCLDGMRHSEWVCVVKAGGKARVYYVERDRPEELATFSLVEDAYSFVHRLFEQWLGSET